jgi:hypothetical protein
MPILMKNGMFKTCETTRYVLDKEGKHETLEVVNIVVPE